MTYFFEFALITATLGFSFVAAFLIQKATLRLVLHAIFLEKASAPTAHGPHKTILGETGWGTHERSERTGFPAVRYRLTRVPWDQEAPIANGSEEENILSHQCLSPELRHSLHQICG